MRTVLSGLFFLHIAFLSVAQERCATTDYTQLQKTAASLQSQRITEAENFLLRQQTLAAQNKTTGSTQNKNTGAFIIQIPVVVHVVYKDGGQGISDAQIRSEIEVLNKDFRRKNSDTANTPERFKSFAADVQIEFYLATTDPNGKATTGIVRRQTSIANWLSNDHIKYSSQGGDDAWDSKSYLNIWLCNLVSGSGYATVPGSDGDKDGVVINGSAFGTINVSGSYNLGRTATHEIGHWLGLRHIWGDAPCGDDLVYDTPQQGWYTQGCPNGFRSSCDNGTMGDMYMNFMDYTSDVCMNLFTDGQKKRMLSNFADGGPRASILQSKGLQKPWLEESPLVENTFTALIYPNPAHDEITIVIREGWKSKTISVFSVNGSLVQTIVAAAGSQKLNIASYKPGMYFIKGAGLNEKFIKL